MSKSMAVRIDGMEDSVRESGIVSTLPTRGSGRGVAGGTRESGFECVRGVVRRGRQRAYARRGSMERVASGTYEWGFEYGEARGVLIGGSDDVGTCTRRLFTVLFPVKGRARRERVASGTRESGLEYGSGGAVSRARHETIVSTGAWCDVEEDEARQACSRRYR